MTTTDHRIVDGSCSCGFRPGPGEGLAAAALHAHLSAARAATGNGHLTPPATPGPVEARVRLAQEVATVERRDAARRALLDAYEAGAAGDELPPRLRDLRALDLIEVLRWVVDALDDAGRLA